MRITAKLKSIINAPLILLGYELKRRRSLENAPWLKEMDVRTVIDVGASIGEFSASMRKLFPQAKIYAFEPVSFTELTRKMSVDPLFHAYPYALGEKNALATMNANEFAPSSSLLPMAEAHVAEFPYTAHSKSIEVQMRRLDSLSLQLTKPMLIKLDVQGFELHVLRGAEETLPRVQVVECELSLLPLYSGQPLIGDVVGHLDARGFALTALEPPFVTRSGRIVQLDGLFARAPRT